MAKANQYHRAGSTFRHVTDIKIPLEQRTNNKNKWKAREKIKKTSATKKGTWWDKKQGGQ